jgi:transcriptional regulator with XRE-family HTH domain
VAVRPFGERVRERRIQEGLSQGELARKVDISRNYLSQIERGEATNLSWQLVERLTTILGLKEEHIEEAALDRATLPAGLAEFAQTAKLPDDDVRMLARLQYRGRQPTSPTEWRILYNVIKAAIGEPDQE